MLDTIPGTNQYWAMSVTFLAKDNNESPRLTWLRHAWWPQYYLPFSSYIFQYITSLFTLHIKVSLFYCSDIFSYRIVLGITYLLFKYVSKPTFSTFYLFWKSEYSHQHVFCLSFKHSRWKPNTHVGLVLFLEPIFLNGQIYISVRT